MDTTLLKIGHYAVNQPISDYPNARKVSLWGRMFGSRVLLPGEIPYDGGKIELLDSNWSVNLGIYQKRIIRISASWVCKNKEAMEKKFCELTSYCEQRFEWNRPECIRKDIKTWQTQLGVIKTDIQTLSVDGIERFFTITLEAISNPFVK